MTIRPTLALSALLLASCGESEPPPHVVLVVVDTLRADALGCNGHEAAQVGSR